MPLGDSNEQAQSVGLILPLPGHSVGIGLQAMLAHLKDGAVPRAEASDVAFRITLYPERLDEWIYYCQLLIQVRVPGHLSVVHSDECANPATRLAHVGRAWLEQPALRHGVVLEAVKDKGWILGMPEEHEADG